MQLKSNADDDDVDDDDDDDDESNLHGRFSLVRSSVSSLRSLLSSAHNEIINITAVVFKLYGPVTLFFPGHRPCSRTQHQSSSIYHEKLINTHYSTTQACL